VFGYINVFKDELKIKDYNIYRAYYCGLCKMLGKRHNQLVRLSLNYDFTFLAVLLDAINPAEHQFTMSGCVKKLGKKKIISSANGLDFAADMNVILAYYKLKDDIADNGSVKARVGVLPFAFRAKKLKKTYPALCKTISDSLKRLSFLEELNCDTVDKAAHEFACVMQAIFKEKEEALTEFGYHLGRFIYIIDAYDDMDKDYRNKAYNPAVLQFNYRGEYTPEIRESVRLSLYNSLAKIGEIYSSVKILKNKEILDNIIYLGIRAKSDLVINQLNKGKEIR